MKKIKMLIFVGLLLGFAFQVVAQKSSKMDAPTVKDDSIALIKKAKSIKVYELESFKAEDSKIKQLESFAILREGIVKPELMEDFRKLLLDTSTYVNTNDLKMCLFLPKLGLSFSEGKETANVLIAFRCNILKLYYKNKVITKNIEPGSKKVIDFFKTVFETPTMAMGTKVSNKPIYYTVVKEDAAGWKLIAEKATKTCQKEITAKNLLDWNKVPDEDVKGNKGKVMLQPGDKIIIGFE